MNRRRSKKLTRRLFHAVWEGDARAVRAVLRSGADPLARSTEGETPLYAASVNGNAEIARVLLSAGAPPNVESGGLGSEGLPLCAAACWGHTEAVRELLRHGADPRLREDGGAGRTAVEWARDAGPHEETVAVLTAAES